MASPWMKDPPFDCNSAIQEDSRGYELMTRLQHVLGPQDDGRPETLAGALFDDEVLQALSLALSILKSRKILIQSHYQVDTKAGSPLPGSLGSMGPAPDNGNQRDQGSRCQRDQGKRNDQCSWTTLTCAPHDDGYLWRKYGEKKVQGSKFSRCYYRCTYSKEEGCLATKRVQQQDRGDPPMFLVSYSNEHTCNTLAAATDQLVQASPSEPFSLRFNSDTYVNKLPPPLSPSLSTAPLEQNGRKHTRVTPTKLVPGNPTSSESMEMKQSIFATGDAFPSTSPGWDLLGSEIDSMIMDSSFGFEVDYSEFF